MSDSTLSAIILFTLSTLCLGLGGILLAWAIRVSREKEPHRLSQGIILTGALVIICFALCCGCLGGALLGYPMPF